MENRIKQQNLSPSAAEEEMRGLDLSRSESVDILANYFFNYRWPDPRSQNLDYIECEMVRISAKERIDQIIHGNYSASQLEAITRYVACLPIFALLYDQWSFVRGGKAFDVMEEVFRKEISRRLGQSYVRDMVQAMKLYENRHAWGAEDFGLDLLTHRNQHLRCVAAFNMGVGFSENRFMEKPREIFNFCYNCEAEHPGILEAYITGAWSMGASLHDFAEDPWNIRRNLKKVWIEVLSSETPLPFCVHLPMMFPIREAFGDDPEFVLELIEHGLEEVAVQTAEENWNPAMIPVLETLASRPSHLGQLVAFRLDHVWPYQSGVAEQARVYG